MRTLINALIIFFAFTFSAHAIELVGQFATPQQAGPSLLLFYSPTCVPCKEILHHHAIPYAKTDTGKKFPLIVVNTFRMPQWLKDAFKEGRIKKGVTFPILIKWDGEKELGRMTHVPE